MLNPDFISYTRKIFGEERWKRYEDAFSEDVPVSVRLNPWKTEGIDLPLAERVPWCEGGYYLSERPDFTLDPLLHAGCYYVQEASSMFLDEVLRQLFSNSDANTSGLLNKETGTFLDLCAAPGGKSTLVRAALGEGWQLFSNEPDRRRSNILMENIQKQGHPKVIVTNNYAKDYRKAKLTFDAILCDVPCSGEGMFRKDEDTIGEWSLQNVMKCAQLQRSIIEDIWQCLKPGGILIYSTCTFNLNEDEENVRWITENLGAELIPINIKEEWNITGSLLEDWQQPVYRFIPGTSRGEGLFMAVLKKTSDDVLSGKVNMGALHILSDGNPQPTIKGKNVIPAHAESLLYDIDKNKYPLVELDVNDARRYLHHEALVLPPDTPRGIIIVTYKNHPLGFMKNIGNRANNLYPQEWKIRKDVG